MKTERRHDLETNELAKRANRFLERIGPHSTTIVTAILVGIGLMVVLSYINKSSAARRGEAWDAYNLAIEGYQPELDILKQSAEQHAGSKMAQWSNVTWADGQLWLAARNYLVNRASANEYLAKAEGAYQSLISSSAEERVRDRARFGLARVYEMQNDVDEAREMYRTVSGAFAQLARQRAEALDSERTVEASQWLASAELPRPRQPAGPGTPGEKPGFEAEGFNMLEKESESGESLSDILKGFQPSESEEDADRYSAADDAPATPPEGDSPAEPPAKTPGQPANDGETPKLKTPKTSQEGSAQQEHPAQQGSTAEQESSANQPDSSQQQSTPQQASSPKEGKEGNSPQETVESSPSGEESPKQESGDGS